MSFISSAGIYFFNNSKKVRFISGKKCNIIIDTSKHSIINSIVSLKGSYLPYKTVKQSTSDRGSWLDNTVRDFTL